MISATILCDVSSPFLNMNSFSSRLEVGIEMFQKFRFQGTVKWIEDSQRATTEKIFRPELGRFSDSTRREMPNCTSRGLYPVGTILTRKRSKTTTGSILKQGSRPDQRISPSLMRQRTNLCIWHTRSLIYPKRSRKLSHRSLPAAQCHVSFSLIQFRNGKTFSFFRKHPFCVHIFSAISDENMNEPWDDARTARPFCKSL